MAVAACAAGVKFEQRLIVLRRRLLRNSEGDSAPWPCLVGRRSRVDHPLIIRVVSNPEPE